MSNFRCESALKVLHVSSATAETEHRIVARNCPTTDFIVVGVRYDHSAVRSAGDRPFFRQGAAGDAELALGVEHAPEFFALPFTVEQGLIGLDHLFGFGGGFLEEFDAEAVQAGVAQG